VGASLRQISAAARGFARRHAVGKKNSPFKVKGKEVHACPNVPLSAITKERRREEPGGGKGEGGSDDNGAEKGCINKPIDHSPGENKRKKITRCKCAATWEEKEEKRTESPLYALREKEGGAVQTQ